MQLCFGVCGLNKRRNIGIVIEIDLGLNFIYTAKDVHILDKRH
jgi:hypothetical protein